MATLKVTDRELQTILAELESDLDGYLTDTQARLSKAREEDGSPSAGMGALSASGGSPSASGGSPSASMGSPSASGGSPSAGGEGFPGGEEEGGEAPPMEGAPAGMEGAPPGQPGMEGQPGAQGPVDPAALEAEYSKLPLPELQAHYLAAKAALFAQMGQGQGQGAPQGAPPPSAPPPGPSAGAPPPPGAGAPPQMAMSADEGHAKETYGHIPPNGGYGKEDYTKKSEGDMQAQINELTKIVNLFVGKPIQKAVTGTSYVAKSEETVEVKSITPAQVTAKLSQLTRSPDLKKSDRDLVNGYYEGTVNVSAIAHLLK